MASIFQNWENVLSMMLTRQQQRRQQQSFKAVFQNNPNKPVGLPECLHSGFYWSKDDGGGGDTWSCKTSKAKLHRQQTNIQILHAGCPSCRPTNSVRALNGEIITFHGLARPQAHLEIFRPCLTHWRFLVPEPLVSPLTSVPYII